MTKKTNEEILNEAMKDVMKVLGIEPKHRSRTRHKDPLDFILWKADGKLYRSRKKALETGQKPVRHTLDAEYLLNAWNDEEYETIIEDMTRDEYIKEIKRKVAEYRGK